MGRRAAARARGRPGAGYARARALPAAPRAKWGTPARRVGGRRCPFPYARRAGQLGFPGKREKAREKPTLGELFPLAWNFIGNTCAEEAGTRGGGAGIFRWSRGVRAWVPPLGRGGGDLGNSAGTVPRGEPEPSGEVRSPRQGLGQAVVGPALPWWFSSGMYILVFSLTIHQKMVFKKRRSHKEAEMSKHPQRV